MTTTILSILDELAANPSKKFKEELLAQHATNEVLKRAMYLAYQPTVNFFTKQIPPTYHVDNEGPMPLDHALEAAEQFLSKRVHTGKAAQDYLQWLLSAMEEHDAEVLRRVILRDLRIGCAGNTANKVWKDLILDVPYMRCCLPKDAKLKTWPWKEGVLSQLKSDGSFARLDHFESGECGIGTRNGTEYPDTAFGEIFAVVKKSVPPGMQLHGELLVYDAFDTLLERAEGNGMLNKVAKGGELEVGHTIKFAVWDMIPISEAKPKNKYKVPYKYRLAELDKLTAVGLSGAVEVVETRVVHSIREAYEHYQEQVAQGLEGTILKHPEAIWEDTTSKHQVKFKLDVDVELKVVGFNPGKGKNKDTFGSLQAVSGDGLLTVNATVPKPEERQRIFDLGPAFIGSIITVRSNAMTKVRKDGTRSLFLPRTIEVRDDKHEADDLQRVIDQFEAAVKNLEMLVEG